jgi:predicted TIM-barrel fold metal-dependent hydrolase
MKLNLSNYPLTDNHCHPFPLNREPVDFERNMCIGLYPVKSENMRNTLYFHMMINELRRFFNLEESVSIDEVIAIRNKNARENRDAYVKSLLQDAGYTRLLVDYGYPISQKTLTSAELDEFKSNVSEMDVKSINRIEWVANRLLLQELSFDKYDELLVTETKEMIKSQNLVALKSVIAYFTGLEVKILPMNEVRIGYYSYLADKSDRSYEKIIRDYTFMKACEICKELDIPLQVHTGLGDSPDCNLLTGNPFLLYDAINDSRARDTKIVLIHGSYPYLEELGMILNHYDNLYADISSLVPYASIAAEDKLKKLFEMAPLNKVCFGTDGAGIPEHAWFGGVYFKRVLENFLNELIDKKYISYSFAEQTAKNILYDNVTKIYNL